MLHYHFSCSNANESAKVLPTENCSFELMLLTLNQLNMIANGRVIFEFQLYYCLILFSLRLNSPNHPKFKVHATDWKMDDDLKLKLDHLQSHQEAVQRFIWRRDSTPSSTALIWTPSK